MKIRKVFLGKCKTFFRVGFLGTNIKKILWKSFEG